MPINNWMIVNLWLIINSHVNCVDRTVQDKFKCGRWHAVPVTKPEKTEKCCVWPIKWCEFMWRFLPISCLCIHLGFCHRDFGNAESEWHTWWNTCAPQHQRRKSSSNQKGIIQEFVDLEFYNARPKVMKLAGGKQSQKAVWKKQPNLDNIQEYAKELLTL